MNELKVITKDVENVYHQLGAVLRDLDMILEDMNDRIHDPSNVDTDPPDEYNVFENEDGHDCKAPVDGG